jgi:hypothetical protein
MALIPSARYPAQTDVAAAYPQGKARNATTFQDGSGTPLERDWVNDLWGFLQSLLADARQAPNGLPDQVGASDYLSAVTSLAAKQVEGAALCNFTPQTSGTADALSDCFWSSLLSLFIAAGSNGTLITSPDGRVWTSRTSGVATSINGIAGNSSVLVYVGAAGVIRSSVDAVTWTSRTSGVATDLQDVFWCPGPSLFIAVGASGVILSSPDGITWTPRTSGLAVTISVVGANGSIIVAGASGGALITSPDGITWTSRTSGTANGLGGIAWSPKLSLFAMAAAGGTIITSPDGITWTSRTSGTSQLLRGMAWASHHFVAVGNGGACQISRDGITWAFADGLTTEVYSEPAWDGRTMVIVGTSGLVTKSLRVLN